MPYELVPALDEDEKWLERLRRGVYQELFTATFGGWDETRHVRQFGECWKKGGISIVEVDGVRAGMIQLFERSDGVEVGEIQILPSHQNLGIGGLILRDIIMRAHEHRRRVLLAVGLKNERAYRLYRRLGFQQAERTATHNHMSCEPPSIA